jgi:hypothetical protein
MFPANIPGTRIARFVLCFALTAARPCFADEIVIELKNGSGVELETKAQLEKLLKSYDLSKFTFTRRVLIDEQATPHSHPILTLHARHSSLHNSDDLLLSTYIHEQLHWYLVAHRSDTEAAEAELRKIYPKVPVGPPDGAEDEESTYLHLVDCYLEMLADRQLMGRERAANVMRFWSEHHYRWVYKAVVENESRIAAVIQREHLQIP